MENKSDEASDPDKRPREVVLNSKVAELRNLLGQDVVLLPVRRETKTPIGKWGELSLNDMSDPSHREKLNNAVNIGVVQGEVSNGLCSIDIDDDEWVERIMKLNPMLSETLQTKGARGCNFWVRCIGDYPKTRYLKADGKPFGEFRSNGSQTVIKGIHPSECLYEIIHRASPIELNYADLNFGEHEKNTHTHNTSSGTLNSEICNLNTVLCTLYNKPEPPGDKPETPDSILANIASRNAAVSSLRLKHPTLLSVYEDYVESRFRAIAGGRNAFLTEAVPFLYRAVTPRFILPLVEHFYLCNQALFNDPLENHMKEATAMMDGVEATYLNELGNHERVIYVALVEREQDLFRLCRDLALVTEQKQGQCTFYAPMDKFGHRLGLKGTQVSRNLKTFESYPIIRCIEKGMPWAKGARAKAGTYLWLPDKRRKE